LVKRNIIEFLNEWRNDPLRRPLIMRGARQVGKTTVIKEFGQNFDEFLYYNLELVADKKPFEEVQDIEKLVTVLFLNRNKRWNSKKACLLFIDEAQEVPGTINQLRYFFESYPELFVILSGSLLDHAINKLERFPVGRIQYATLYPMNFVEFLRARGNKNVISVLNEVPFPDFAEQTLMDNFHDYAIIGGMPRIMEAVQYGKKLEDFHGYYGDLLKSYQDDIRKYAKSKTQEQIISFVLKNAPLQFLDTGIMNYALGIQADLIGLADLNDASRGKIIQHLIYQEIRSTSIDPNFELHFWVRDKDSDAEVDLVVPVNKYLIPVEIKSGPSGKLRSLHEYMDRTDHPYAIRFYQGPLLINEARTKKGKQFHLLNLPYFLGTKLKAYAEWFLRQYKN